MNIRIDYTDIPVEYLTAAVRMMPRCPFCLIQIDDGEHDILACGEKIHKQEIHRTPRT